MGTFAIDGTEYAVALTSLQRNAAVLDGENAGRSMDGLMVRDVIGTCYNYGLVISPAGEVTDYNALYEVITSPDDSHSFTLPYGQGSLTFDAYVANTSDSLLREGWFQALTFNAITIDPQREAEDSATGSGTRSDAPFTMDGVGYQMAVTKLTRNSAVLDGDEAGRLLSGHMERDVIGTYYNYSAEITAIGSSPEEYDSFYEAVTSPVDSHTFVFPYGAGTLTVEAYVANASDKLRFTQDGYAHWGGLTINFIAMQPTRTQ